MADIRAAAKALHDSRQLSEVERAEYWLHEVVDGDKHIVTAGGVWVTDCGRGEVAGLTAGHIARIAPPLVTEATEDLLIAVDKFRNHIPEVLHLFAEALAAAILREDR